MRWKSPFSALIATVLVAAPALAALSTHVVQPGDTLSQIAQRLVSEPIYGKGGSLERVLSLNPEISNPNLIYPGETIHLGHRSLAGESPEAPAAVPQVDSLDPVQHAEVKNPWRLSIHAGAGSTYFRLTQKGAFGAGKGGTLTLPSWSLGAEVRREEWSFGVKFDRYTLDFGLDTTDSTRAQKKTFQSHLLHAGYGNLRFGLRARTTPVLRTLTATEFAWGDLTTYSALAGYGFSRDLGPAEKKFTLGANLLAEVPFAGTGSSGVAVSGLKGYGANASLSAKKALTAHSSHLRLSGGLNTEASLRRIHYQGSWAGTSGKITESFHELSSGVFLELEW